ncbi:MAG: primary-amine oxidase [Chloroflexota bacterium]
MLESTVETGHPLDPLSPGEIRRAVEIVRADRRTGNAVLFSQVDLLEPEKGEYVAAAGAGRLADLDRRARVVLIDREARCAHDLVVSIATGAVLSWDRVEAGEPPLTMAEIERCERDVRADPRLQAALNRRGITDMRLVWVDPWSVGAYEDERDLRGRRLARGLIWVRSGPDDLNGYAHPVENLHTMYDLDTAEVLWVHDGEAVPVPAQDANFDAARCAPFRPDLRPLVITQPEGPSFTVEGREVRWQKWRFRVGYNAREGLVLHQLAWEDAGETRPILHRASMCEMVVPYGDPAFTHRRKNTFDAGELNLGAMANSLTLGCDCLGVIHYFDAAVAMADGEPKLLKNVVCLHEEDYGVLWRHYDWRSDTTEVRRSRRLVISFFTTLGNYDYGFFWYLFQDGSIECEVKLTGILSTGAVAPGERPAHGQLLNADGLYGPVHQHFFSFRLDFDVDGEENSVYEEHVEPMPPGPGNPLNAAFHHVRRKLEREQEAQRLADPLNGRSWKVVSSRRRNAVGEPTGYRLAPHGNVLAMPGEAANVTQRAGFITRHLWVTPYHPQELHAAGDFCNQHPGGAGLPAWTAADRPIEDRDLVVWYTLGTYHQARTEDWPVMPVAYAGFGLHPSGFFDANPALDVPPPDPHRNGSCCA